MDFRLWSLALFAFTVAASPPVAAQGYPSRPVRIVVPLAAGGSTDAMTRLVAEKLAARWGQPVVVENKSGAATTIGADFVARSAPDGHTLLVATAATVITQYANPKVPYNIESSFIQVGLLFTTPLVLVVNPAKIPARNLAEFVAYVKQHPGKIPHATAGAGSISHFAGALFDLKTGIDPIAVHYRGAGQSMTSLLAGEVFYTYTLPSDVLQHVKAGKLRVLAVSGNKRLAQLADVPTFKETGYPDFQVTSWFGLWAPAGQSTQDKHQQIGIKKPCKSHVDKVCGEAAVA